jgi:outer membrane protein TolC
MVVAGFFLAATVSLSGCVGTATPDENLARQDSKSAAAKYRPAETRPQLPVLTENSNLTDLIKYALLNNPAVEAAYYDWAASVEEITTARSLPDPMLTFGAEISRDGANVSAALGTDPMNNWPGPGKLPLRAEAAYGASLKKRAIFEREMLATALAVKRAWFQRWVLEEKIRRTSEIIALLDEMEALARARVSVGKATQQDVLRAQMERDQLRTDLAGLEDSRAPLVARLRSALGLAPQAPLPDLVPRDFEATTATFTEQALLETAFARNPQLKAMRAEVGQAVALYDLARKNTVPDYAFGVGASGGMNPVAVSPMFGITLPVWRDKIAAEVAAGRADLGAAQARLSAEQLDLAVRFAETAYAWREADRNVALHGRLQLPKAHAALDAAREGYVSGAASFRDVLDAERDVLEHHLRHAEALGEREMVLAEMSLVVLGQWPENVEPVLPETEGKAEKVRGKQ